MSTYFLLDCIDTKLFVKCERLNTDILSTYMVNIARFNDVCEQLFVLCRTILVHAAKARRSGIMMSRKASAIILNTEVVTAMIIALTLKRSVRIPALL